MRINRPEVVFEDHVKYLVSLTERVTTAKKKKEASDGSSIIKIDIESWKVEEVSLSPRT